MKRCILLVSVLALTIFIAACSHITYDSAGEQVLLTGVQAETDIHRAFEGLGNIIGHSLEDAGLSSATQCLSRMDDFIQTEEVRSLRRGLLWIK